MATPSALAEGSNPLALVDTYVQVVSPVAAYEPFCGKVVSWDGIDAGFTVRKMGTCNLVFAVIAKDMQFIPQKYSSMLGASPILAPPSTAPRACEMQPSSSELQPLHPTAPDQSQSFPAVNISSPLINSSSAPPRADASSSESSDEDVPISELQARRADKSLIQQSVASDPATVTLPDAAQGVIQLPSTSSASEQYAIRIQFRGTRRRVGQFSSAAVAARTCEFLRRQLGASGGDGAGSGCCRGESLSAGEEAYAMQCLSQLRGETVAGETPPKVSSFVGVRPISLTSGNFYEARITLANKHFNLGRFSNIDEAAAAYDFAVRFSDARRKTNFPRDQPLHLPDQVCDKLTATLTAADESPVLNSSATSLPSD